MFSFITLKSFVKKLQNSFPIVILYHPDYLSIREGSDPIAMDLYALGITPLLSKLIPRNRENISTDPFHQIATADDFTGCR